MSESQGRGALFWTAWILVSVFAVVSIVFIAMYFTKKPKPVDCPVSPVPDDADIKDDTVVIYDKVGSNQAEGREFENTYFKKVLFKCAGSEVPDTYWDAPFDAATTAGNQFGVTGAPIVDKDTTTSNGTGTEPNGTGDVTNEPETTSTTPSTTSTTNNGSGDSEPAAAQGDGTAAPQAGESFKSISRNRAPPHRYPFW